MESTLDQVSIHEFKRVTEDKLRNVLCPEHRQRPRVRVIGTSIREAKLSLTGCCDTLMALANQAIWSTNGRTSSVVFPKSLH